MSKGATSHTAQTSRPAVPVAPKKASCLRPGQSQAFLPPGPSGRLFSETSACDLSPRERGVRFLERQQAFMASLAARRAVSGCVSALPSLSPTATAVREIQPDADALDITVEFTDTTALLAPIEEEETPRGCDEECTGGRASLPRPPVFSEDATDDILDGAMRLLAERDSQPAGCHPPPNESAAVMPKFTSISEALEATVEASGAPSVWVPTTGSACSLSFQPQRNPMVSGLVSMMQAAALAALQVQ